MSFFLSEVSMLDLRDKQMVGKYLQNDAEWWVEEERDAFSGGGDAPTKEFSLFSNESLLRHSAFYLITSKIYQISEDYYPHANHSEKYSPPGLLYFIFSNNFN